MKNLHKTRRKKAPPPSLLPPTPSPPLIRTQLAPKKHLKLCQKSIDLAFLTLLHLFILLIGHNHHHNIASYQAQTRSNTDNQYQAVSDNHNGWVLSSFVRAVSAAETYILRDHHHQKLFLKNNSIDINGPNRTPLIKQQETSPTPTNHQRQAAKVSISSGGIKHQPVARLAGQLITGPRRAPPGNSKVGLVQQQQQPFNDATTDNNEFNGGGLQISITPRNGQIRVPVGENTILKCLISSQVNKFMRKFDVHWSRYMYDENVYEQLESFTGAGNDDGGDNNGDESTTVATSNDNPATLDSSQPELYPALNRQQQLRNFLSRSRQETNAISDLLIEATLSISPVKASDNATYYCEATDGGGANQSASSPSWPSTIGGQHQDRARIDLVALSKPVVRLDRVQPARDSKSAQVNWLILSDGNTPIKRTILMVRNESLHQHQYHSTPSTSHNQVTSMHQHQQQHQELDEGGSFVHPSVVVDSDKNQWQRIDIPGDGELPVNFLDDNSEPSRGVSLLLPEDSVVRADVDITSLGGNGNGFPSDLVDSSVSRRRPSNGGRLNRRRSFNLTSLLPGVTYHLKLAAINDMGQSNWTHLSATMPNEIPAQISEMFLLSRSNDSLAIGWKRPAYDGAKTIRYEMQLFDLNRTLTLDANTNTTSPSGPESPSRTNFMYYFVNLNPGTDYHFHVRACSRAGCSAFSQPKLLASTLDGEPDEPVDVELNCQMMDPQQQQQLQLQPGQASSSAVGAGNASISWLPPVNTRGQLTNYSVHLESYSRYLNQSGEWQVNEWRSTMETPNNHTLSLEMGGLLMPNTNYTVRVCANNRSKHCGRLSSVSPRTQCSTPPELPQQLPANLRLNRATLSNIVRQENLFGSSEQQRQLQQQLKQFDSNNPDAETIVLDLPTISRRNGSIDCIQVVLIRLPDSYSQAAANKLVNSTGGGRVLEQFLPREPSDIRLVPYANLQQQPPPNPLSGDNENEGAGGSVEQQMKDGNSQVVMKRGGQKQVASDLNERALAYLADEISGDHDANLQQVVASNGGFRKIVLGDGGQTQACQKLLHTAPEELRPFDGGLRPSTYYTGFIRLLMIRHNSLNKKTELVAKYSGYFEPIKTSKLVIEIPASMRLGSGDDDGESMLTGGDDSLMNSFNFSQVTSSMSNFQEFASRLGSSLRSSAIKLYHNSSSFLVTNFKLETVSNYIMNSSPMMQLLEVGVIVLGLSLFLLLAIYLISLPNSMLRKRKRKLKRQLQKHQEAAAVAAAAAAAANQATSGDIGSHQHLAPPGSQSPPQMPLQQQQVQSNYDEAQQQIVGGYTNSRHGSVALNGPGDDGILSPAPLPPSSSSYQLDNCNMQLEQQPHLHHPQQQQVVAPSYGTAARNPQECPIHSSPMNRGQQRDNSDGNQATVNRRPSVHVCHPSDGSAYVTGQQQQSTYGSSTNNPIGHHAHHHHHHHQQQQQLMNSSSNQISSYANQDYFARHPAAAADQYERNCRTTSRRLRTTNGGPGNGDYGPHDGALTNGNELGALGNNNNPRNAHHYTLNHHQHNSALALAKKINKSIPLSLFGQVLEYRLRNNWLREEYDQLPRQQFIMMDNNSNNGANEAKNLLLLKLRPQLIVSRNDTVSALISGNDLFDASLIRGGIGGGSGVAPSNGGGASAGLPPPTAAVGEKRIICAKSPLDADSVWDFWRLVYEQEVSTMVMLTQTEDQQTGEIRCAQYWPTCDNEETTILSPCNEYVQKSTILPAKFKIRQETLEEEGSLNDFKVRRLTFMVMATKPGENEQTNEDTPAATAVAGGQKGGSQEAPAAAAAEGGNEAPEGPDVGKTGGDGGGETTTTNENNGLASSNNNNNNNNGEDDDEEELIIVERTILHLQYFYWNTSSLANQMRFIKFIEMANERHTRSHELNQQSSPGSINLAPSTMLVHCFNGLGRSGLFTAMSFIVDELAFKLSNYQQQQVAAAAAAASNEQQQQQPVVMQPKLNLFQLVSRLRMQREMLLSPYRFYELLYQLTLNCIPSQDYTTSAVTSSYHHHHHHQQHQFPQHQQQQHQQHGHHKHHHHHHQQQQQYQMLSSQQQQTHHGH